MNKNVKIIPSLTLQIFFFIFILKDILPVFLVLTAKLLHFNIPENLSFIFSSLSVSAGKILIKDNYPYNILLFYTIIVLIVFFVFFKFISGNLNFLRSHPFVVKNWFVSIRFLVIFNTIILILKMFSGTRGYETGEWSSSINIFLTLGLNIVFLIYLFTKQAKHFFLITKDSEILIDN